MNESEKIAHEYTLTLLFGHGRFHNVLHAEWNKLRDIPENFFYPISASRAFVAKVETWMRQSAEYKWHTSPLKIVDNLLIGLQKLESAEPPDSTRRRLRGAPPPR